jgi:hypothetical protein
MLHFWCMMNAFIAKINAFIGLAWRNKFVI